MDLNMESWRVHKIKAEGRNNDLKCINILTGD